MKLGGGEELSATCDDMAARLDLAIRAGDVSSTLRVRISLQAAKNLLGQTISTSSLSDEGWDETEADVVAANSEEAVLAGHLHATRAALSVIYGRFEEALVETALCEAKSAALHERFFSTPFAFFAALARMGALGFTSREGALGVHLARLAEGSPEEDRHLSLGASAEVARLEGRQGEARELYDEAIELAKRNHFTHHEAILAELAGRSYEARGRVEMARMYLARAKDAYSRWGARAKVAAMEAAELLRVETETSSRGAALGGEATTSMRMLDAVAVVRASEAIASEIDLPKLLDRLMRMLIERSGADHGALVLLRDDEWMLEAVAHTSPDETRVGLSLPLAAAPDVAANIVEHVARTRETLVLSNPADDGRFGRDARLEERRPAAVFSFPLVRRGALSGVVYLESRAARGAFGKDRIEILSLLSSQAAIALENALLLADVRFRTSELAQTNAELHRELAERERAEAERANLKQGIISLQKERLAELRTPFIPLTADVMVMPLVGTLDGARAEEALVVALSGAASRGARVVILDITGVKRVDEDVARTLVRMVEALRLLGAEAIVTGVRGDVARTLTALDIDFGAKVTTKSTLEAGIRHALRGKPKR